MIPTWYALIPKKQLSRMRVLRIGGMERKYNGLMGASNLEAPIKILNLLNYNR